MMKQILLKTISKYMKGKKVIKKVENFRKVKLWLTSLLVFYHKICLCGQEGSSTRFFLFLIQQGFKIFYEIRTRWMNGEMLWKVDEELGTKGCD